MRSVHQRIMVLAARPAYRTHGGCPSPSWQPSSSSQQHDRSATGLAPGGYSASKAKASKGTDLLVGGVTKRAPSSFRWNVAKASGNKAPGGSSPAPPARAAASKTAHDATRQSSGACAEPGALLAPAVTADTGASAAAEDSRGWLSCSCLVFLCVAGILYAVWYFSLLAMCYPRIISPVGAARVGGEAWRHGAWEVGCAHHGRWHVLAAGMCSWPTVLILEACSGKASWKTCAWPRSSS